MADSVLSPESVQKLKVADLKKELKERGLPVSGSKSELAERLLKGLQDTSVGGAGDQDVSLGEENISLEDHEEDLVLKEDKKDEPEEPPKKKIALIAPVKITPEPVTSPTDTEKEKTEVSEAERLKKRAERFGAKSEQTKLQMRAERFGITANSTTTTAKPGKITPTAVTPEDLDKLKKRAERFGTNVSTTLSKLEEDERIKKRKERFGAMVTTKPGSTVSLSDTDEKKQKRAERFGIL